MNRHQNLGTLLAHVLKGSLDKSTRWLFFFFLSVTDQSYFRTPQNQPRRTMHTPEIALHEQTHRKSRRQKKNVDKVG